MITLFIVTWVLMNLAAIPRIIEAWEKENSLTWGIGGLLLVSGIDITVLAAVLTAHITITFTF